MAKSAKPGSVPPPRCKAILLCDLVIVDQQTGRPSIVNIFDGLVANADISETLPFVVFVQLVGGIGDYPVSLEVHDLADGTVVLQQEAAELAFADRLEVINLVIPVPPLFVEHEGSYDLVVLADRQEIDRQTIENTFRSE